MFSKYVVIILIMGVSFHLLTNLSEAQSWTEITTTGSPPPARFGHKAVYDSVNNRMTIFGGTDGGNYYNDVWVLSTANGLGGTSAWTELLPTGSAPSTRDVHSAVYDSANNNMIIFGGYNNNDSNYFNDVWVLSHANGLGGTSAWAQLFPTGSAPTTRLDQTAVYDTTNNRMIVFGGTPDGYSVWLNDVWVLSTANGLGGTPAWTQLSPTGSVPTTREGHTAIYDNVNNRMTIFGGYNGSAMNDVWVLSHANGLGGTPAWTQITTTGSSPTTRFGHTAVYNPSTNRMTIFGGAGAGVLNDAWVLSHANGLGGTPAWAQITTAGSTPAVRNFHTAIYDAANNHMTIFGGIMPPLDFLNDVWVLDIGNTVDVKNWMNYSFDLQDFY